MQQHERANKRRTAGAGKGTAGEQQENSRRTAGAEPQQGQDIQPQQTTGRPVLKIALSQKE